MINDCLSDILLWARQNCLKINSQKTELIHFSSRFNPASLPACIVVDGLNVHETTKARNLGVCMDQHLQLKEHVKIMTQSAMCALKRIGKIRNYLCEKTTEKLVHAFVSSRIDFCNSLLFGLPEKDIRKLQIVQNCAARLVMRAKGRDPITPLLSHLHWLPVDKRIMFMISVLCHKTLIYKFPTYLSEIIIEYVPQRNLRSSSQNMLIILRTRICSYGDRAF